MKRKLIIRVGEKSLHAISMRSCFGKRAVENIQRVHYDDGIVSDGSILNPIALSGIIQEFMNGLRFKFLYEIVFLLNSSRIIIKDIHIPRVKHKNLKGVMINRIDELFPDIREFNYRYRIKEENESGFEMQVVFIPKDLYNGYNDVYRSLKLMNGNLDVGYNSLVSFVDENGFINGEKLRDGEYILINISDFNGEIIHCANSRLKNHRSVYHPNGGSELRKKVIESIYFDFDEIERDKIIVLSGDEKEVLKNDVLREFNLCPILAEQISIHSKEIQEKEIYGFIDGFSRAYSNRLKGDYRINFLSRIRDRGESKIIYKISAVLIVILIFYIYSINLDSALKYEMDKLENMNEKGFSFMDESKYEENKVEDNAINTTAIGKRDDVKKVISLVQKHAKIGEIAFNGFKYNVKGVGEEINYLGELIKDLQRDGYKKSHLIGMNRHSGET